MSNPVSEALATVGRGYVRHAPQHSAKLRSLRTT